MRCFVAVVGLLVVLSRGAVACSCTPPPSVAFSFGYSDAVFIGEVVSVRDTSLGAGGYAGYYGGKVARLRVSQSWLGVRQGDLVTVLTGAGGGDCGYRFYPGRHLIYATHFMPSTFTTNICTRSKAMPYAAADSVALTRLPH
jgi:hypothetical protein